MFKNTPQISIWKALPWLLVIMLPATIVIPHISSSFFGTDFLFPFNRIHGLSSVINLWQDDYLGDRNIGAGSFLSLILSKISWSFAGERYAPQLYIYLVLVAYLGSIHWLVKYIRTSLRSNSDDKTESVYPDSLLVLISFLSPVLLGYFANYFTVGIVLATVPVVWALYFLIKFLDSHKFSALLTSVVFVSLISHSPTCIFFVGLESLILLMAGRIRAIATFLIAFVGLSAIWLAPLLLSFLLPGGGASMSADSSYINHIFEWYSNAANILSNGVFSIYPSNKLFNVIPMVLFLILFFVSYLAIFLGVIYSRTIAHQKKNAHLLYLFIVACLAGLTFSFGGKYAAGDVFSYLWQHVSLLHFFKSFTQVLNVAFIFFIAALASALAILPNRVRTLIITGLSLPLLIILFYLPSFNAHIARGTIPDEYTVAREMIASDTEVSRVLTLPEITYEYYVWNGSDWDQYFAAQRWFSKPVVYFGVITPSVSRAIHPKDNEYTDFFTKNNFRYLLVHHDYDETKFKPQKFTVDSSKIDNVYHNSYFDLYRLKDEYFTPRIYTGTTSTTNINFIHVSDIRYQVHISHLVGTTSLTMLESYDTGWKIAPATVSGECGQQNGVNNPMAMLMRTSLADDTHTIVNKYANGWVLDASAIRKGYSEKYYNKNQDGSIDVCLTIYYRPQVYFYLAAFVSIFSLVWVTILITLAYKKDV